MHPGRRNDVSAGRINKMLRTEKADSRKDSGCESSRSSLCAPVKLSFYRFFFDRMRLISKTHPARSNAHPMVLFSAAAVMN